MHLYSGPTTAFADDALHNRMAPRLAEAFFDYFGYRVSESEARSWRNSLRAMADAVRLGNLEDHGIAVEVQLPLSSRRLDCLITGRNRIDRPSAVIVELKQWESVAASDVDECVLVAYGTGRPLLHPSHQVAGYATYLRDTHSAFADDAIELTACSFLHNMNVDEDSPLFDDKFAAVLAEAPLFTGDQIDRLAATLRDQLAGGDGLPILEEVLKGQYRPQKRLLEHTAGIIRGHPAFTLLDEQRVAFNDVLGHVDRARVSGNRTVILIRGGPGTGKSVIGVNLLAELAGRGVTVEHATGSKSFTATLRKRVGGRASAQFKYFNSYAQSPDALDVIICDEAHRIRASSVSRFTPKAARSKTPQIEELLNTAKTSVFFIDDLQVVRPGEMGSTQLIKAAAARLGIPVAEHELETQFRCGGSDAFVGWVENLLDLRRTPFALWDSREEFAFDVLDSPEELDALVRARSQEGEAARITAGFCWRWSDPREDGTLVDDVAIGSWRRPWNAKADQKRLATGIPKSEFWATDPAGIDQVGCVYTAQGFEFDYAGVIWGNDLVWRPRQGWVGQPAHNFDTVVTRGAAKDLDAFTSLVKQTYRVLLTRGLKGCYVYFTDEQTRDFVLGRLKLPED